MAKIISIIGSTGSIGVQTLEVARNLGIKIFLKSRFMSSCLVLYRWAMPN